MKTRWVLLGCVAAIGGVLLWRGVRPAASTTNESAPEAPGESSALHPLTNKPAYQRVEVAPLRERRREFVTTNAAPVLPPASRQTAAADSKVIPGPDKPRDVTGTERSALSPRSLEGGSVNPFTGEPERAIVGIGAVLAPENGTIRIRDALPNSPAMDANLAGSTIVAVNGIALTDLPLAEVVKMIRGPEGTTIKLEVIGPNGDRQTVDVVRRTVRLTQ